MVDFTHYTRTIWLLTNLWLLWSIKSKSSISSYDDYSYVATQDSNTITTAKKGSRTLTANFLSSSLQQTTLLKLKNDLQFYFTDQENLENGHND